MIIFLIVCVVNVSFTFVMEPVNNEVLIKCGIQ